ncbi:MAG TPA: DUF389 domain-containing protein [Caldilineae bacterium]|nr:DUF389 domain-containing protein [Caldilineae bacterium]
MAVREPLTQVIGRAGEQVKRRTRVRRPSSAEGRDAYHVMVAVGEERQLVPLASFGCALARSREGRMTLVTVTPDGTRPPWLKVPPSCADVPVDVLVLRQMKAPGQDLAHLVNQKPPDLLVIGWRGEPKRGRYLLGRTLDPVLRNVLCDVAVVRSDFARTPRNVLVPTAGGPNAARALEIALSLGSDVQITALYVAQRSLGQPEVILGRERLRAAVAPWEGQSLIQRRVVQAHDIVRGILGEANSGRYDLLLIGASNESAVDRALFGNVPQTVAVDSPIPTVVIRRQAETVQRRLRHAWWRVWRFFPTISTAEQVEVYKRIHRGARPGVDFFIMISLSAALAAIGLLMDSSTVIIGAMVVAPLMSALLALGLGVTMGNLRMIRMALGSVLKGAFLAILVGLLVGTSMPKAAPTGEVLARSHPSIVDLVVALLSGMAGAYAICRRDILAALVGVAIAAAVVPPLATVGIGISMGSAQIAGGALLLFLTNLIAISATGGLVFLAFGFQPEPSESERSRVFHRGLLSTLFLVLVVALPLIWLTWRSVQQTSLQRAITDVLTSEVPQRYVEVTEWHICEREGETFCLEITARVDHVVTEEETAALQRRLAARLKRPVSLHVIAIPVQYFHIQVSPSATVPMTKSTNSAALQP